MAAIISHGSPMTPRRWSSDTGGCGGVTVTRPTSAVYRRRRLTVLAFAVALAAPAVAGLAVGAPGGGPLTTSGAGSSPTTRIQVQTVARSTHVVAPGDTLWSIARRLQPEGDVRPLVDALAASRNGRPLQVGERIRLP